MSLPEELYGPVFELKEVGRLQGLVIGYNMKTSRFQFLDVKNGAVTQGFRTVRELKKAKAHSRLKWFAVDVDDVGSKN